MNKQVVVEKFEKQEKDYINKGYQRKDELISYTKVNIMGSVTALPIAVLGILLWIVLKKEFTFTIEWILIILISFVICTFVHVCLYGLVWSLFTNGGWKSIHIGIMRGNPYCHCIEPLKPKQYFIGILTPFMILGILMYILAFLLNSSLFLLISLFNILLAGGSMTIALKVIKYLKQKDCYILDHPTECGFIVLKK